MVVCEICGKNCILKSQISDGYICMDCSSQLVAIMGRPISLQEGREFYKKILRHPADAEKAERPIANPKVVCCVCYDSDCSGGKMLQDGLPLCGKCLSNYVMTAAEQPVPEDFCASHTSDFFREQLSECYNPNYNIAFNFKTQKIYLKDTLLKKNYKVVSFSDVLRCNVENVDGGHYTFRRLNADIRFNGATIRYYTDSTVGGNKHGEFEKTVDCFSRIPNIETNIQGAASSDTACGSAVVPTQNGGNTAMLKCPRCGGTNCTPIVETSTSGKSFSASKGCCGYIILGPLGLLCGACGRGQQTTSTTYWMCASCGNKFQK